MSVVKRPSDTRNSQFRDGAIAVIKYRYQCACGSSVEPWGRQPPLAELSTVTVTAVLTAVDPAAFLATLLRA
jgi:hypothetical protein